MRDHVDELNAFAEAATEQFDALRAARHGRLVARARGAAARRSRSSRFHVLDTTHPDGDPRGSSARARPRAHALPRLLEVGLDARDALAPGLLLGADRRPRSAVRRDHRPRLASSSELAHERGFRAVFPGEPTIGGRYSALSPFGIVPAALMGVDLARLLERAAEMTEALQLEDGNPGLELGLPLGEGWEEGRDKVCVDAIRAGFGLWVEQLLAESTGKEGKGLVPGAAASRRTGRTGSAGEVRLPDAYELGAGVLPLGVRDRRRRPRARDQPVRPAGRAGGEGQDERGARRRASPNWSRAARSTSCSRRRRRGRLRLRSRRSSTRPARASWRRSSSARSRPAAS